MASSFREVPNSVIRATPILLPPCSIPERVAQADRELRRLWLEGGSRNERVLSERDEKLLAWLVFPAEAQRDADALADVVVLRLGDDLHIRREIDAAADLQDVDRDMPRGEVDEGRDIARD